MQKTTGTLTVGHLLKTAAVRYREKEALYCTSTDRRYTFGQLNARVNGLANGLLGLGLHKGDTVAFLCNNRAEIVERFLALAKIGVLGIPLNYRLNGAEIVDLVQSCEAKAFLFAPNFNSVVQHIHTELPTVQHFVGIGEALPDFALDYEHLLQSSSPDEPPVDVREEDIQYLNLTSGTTGVPKSYLLTQYSNVVAAMTMAKEFDMVEKDVVLIVFPMFGRVGFVWTLLSIYMGARQVIADFKPEHVANVIQTEKVTITNLVPTMGSMLLSLPNLQHSDFHSLRGIVFAGSPLPPSTQEAVRQRICPALYEYYGMQETGAVVSIGPEAKQRKPDSVGQMMPFSDVRIVDEEGRDVPVGTIGAILVRSPASTASYYKNEAKTFETFRNGWISTGDLGSFDEEGFLFIKGRTKDMIISGGQNVFSVEVESLLMSHPAVADCTVIGLPDPTWGELVTALIVKVPEATVTEQDIVEFCKRKIAGFKVPKKIIWRTETLPRTPTGKVTKYLLVEQYAKSM